MQASTLGGIQQHQPHARGGSSGTGKRHSGTNLRSDKQDTELDEDGDYSFFRYISIIRDKKRFSWAMLSVLKNNMVSAPFFYLLQIIDYLILVGLFLVFCFTQFQKESEDHKGRYSSEFIISIELQVQDTLRYIGSDNTFQVSALSVIGGTDLLVVLCLIGLALKLESPESAKQSNIVSKFLSVFLHLKAKLTFTLEIIFLSQIFKNTFPNKTQHVFMYAGAVLCLITASVLKLSLAFLLNIRVRLIEEIPWCAHQSATPFVNTTFKLMHGVCLAVAVPQASAIILFLIAALNITIYIYFQPFHNQKVLYIDTFFMSVLFAQYLHLVVVLFDQGSLLSESITLMMFFVAFLTPGVSFFLLFKRQTHLQKSLLVDQHSHHAIKSEADFEKAISLFILQIERGGEKSQHASTFGIQNIPFAQTLFTSSETQITKDLAGLILYHREQCLLYTRGTCFCRQFDDSLLANRLIVDEQKRSSENRRIKNEMATGKRASKMNRKSNKQVVQQSSKTFELMQKEDEEAKREEEEEQHSIEEGDFIENSDSYQTKNQSRRQLLPTATQDTVQRKTSGGGTAKAEKEQDWVQEEQKSFMSGIINPLFQAEQFISQTLMAQRKSQADYMSLLPEEVQQIVEKSSDGLNILNFGNVRLLVIINILYRIIKDYCEQDPKSLKLLLFRAYFELFIMRKKYLAHQTLTRVQGEENLGFLNYAQFQIDQQYLIEKAQLLYQTKEDQMLDVDRIITQNHHYQHFYDLNEESAYWLSVFWSQLSNPKNVDIEKLFEIGVKTSELIKLTKDKFMQLVLLGIDKRNSNLYYMYANFNKYVLNSNDQYQEYMFKMKQIQSMNKTLQDNNYKEQLNQDVDKSGFLLVRGTYHDFGKIIYANRQMCHMLGYTPEQLNTSGKTINVLMPQIISERHSAFLSVFRETGIPVFIQQIQQLFVKNAQGYIQPFKVLIKFHYDKQHGHVFCAIINKNTHFCPFKNKKRLNFDEVLTIMTDDLGTICEISPSVTQYLGMPIKFVQQNQMFLQDNVKIWHMLKVDPNVIEQAASKEVFSQLNPEFHSDSDSGKPVYAAQHCLEVLAAQQQRDNNLDINDDGNEQTPLNQVSKMSMRSNKMNFIKHQVQSLVRELGGIQIDIKVKMAKVCHKKLLTVRYFFIEILENSHFFMDNMVGGHPNNYQIENPLPQRAAQLTIMRYRDNQINDNTNNSSTIGQSMGLDNEKQVLGLNKRIFEENSSTESDAFSKMGDIVEKDIDQLIRNDKRTPKILKHITWLVLFAFLISTIVAAIVTGMFLHESIGAKSSIETLENALERGAYSAHVMSMLRSLINYQLEIEGGEQTLLNTKVWASLKTNQNQFQIDSFLSQQIIGQLDSLKYKQQLLEGVNSREDDQLDIEYLNSQGRLEVQRQPSNVAINVIVSNIIDIVSNIRLLNQVKRFNITFSDYYEYYNHIISAKKPNLSQAEQFTLFQIQKQIFFVFNNYVKVLDKYNVETANYYLQKGKESMNDEVVQGFLIIVCIGIGSLILIVLLVSPVTFKIKKQKYQVLLFFLRLDEHIIKQSCLKSSIFEDKFSQEQFKRGRAFDDDEYARRTMGEDNEELQDDDYVKLGSMNHQAPSDLPSLEGINTSGLSSGIDGPGMNNQSNQRKKELAKLMDDRLTAILKKREQRGATQVYSQTNFNESDLSSEVMVPSQDTLNHSSSFLIVANNLKSLQSLTQKQRSIRMNEIVAPSKTQSTLKSKMTGFYAAPQVGQALGVIEEDDQEMRPTTTNKARVLQEFRKEDKVEIQQQTQGEEIDQTSFGPINQQVKEEEKQAPSSQRKTSQKRPKAADEVRVDDIAIKLDKQKVSTTPTPKVVKKKSRKIKNDDSPGEDGEKDEEQVEQQIKGETNSREEILKKIQTISSHSQSSTIVVIALLFLFFVSFFIGLYLYAKFSLEAYRDSFTDLSQIHNRGQCLSQMFFYAREDMQSAVVAEKSDAPADFIETEVDLPWGTSGYRSRSMSKLWQCMNLENHFTEIKRDNRAYLARTLDEIDLSEHQLCKQAVSESAFSLTVDQCLSIQNGVLKKGLSLAHQDFIKSTLIELLGYFSQIEAFEDVQKKNEFIRDKLRDPTFLEYLYVNDFVLKSVNHKINSTVLSSIEKYIETLKSILIAIFSGVQVLLVAGLVYFFCYLFGQLKRDMLSSHTMIGMMPKHLLHRKDQQKIRDFLLS